jgi:CubicO group peptidase (beta-lactamase class C family)
VNAPLLAALLLTGPQDSAWAPLARVLEDAVSRRAFPGAVVAVGRRDTVLYLRAFGNLDYEHGVPVTTRTVYDVASLTKVVGLTTAVMMLVEQGRIRLDAPARSYVQMFGYAHDSTITVHHLLTHSSGLPAWKPLYQTARNRRGVFDLASREPLEYATGTRAVYSDLGAIVLTEMVETLSGERIDRFLGRRLFAPLGMNDTRYNPPRGWLSHTAPTEVDTTWRRRLVHGRVHDENAAAMGGISGHAGLFSTAPDLARFAQWMLNHTSARTRSGEVGRVPGIVDREIVQMFTQAQDRSLSSRALGWDTPDGQNSAGTRLSERAFGHTGFTGTSMWIDPEQDLFVILLTNRVHPTRENTQIFAVRRQVADLASEIAARSVAAGP